MSLFTIDYLFPAIVKDGMHLFTLGIPNLDYIDVITSCRAPNELPPNLVAIHPKDGRKGRIMINQPGLDRRITLTISLHHQLDIGVKCLIRLAVAFRRFRRRSLLTTSDQ
jgi:hypothetical protein